MSSNPPLAGHCSLCGDGYHPNAEIDIADEPTKGEYRWAHVLCKDDHTRAFMEALGNDW